MMARRTDSGFRDTELDYRHRLWGHAFPVAGMAFPMIEYDRGEPIALLSYQPAGVGLPRNDASFAAHTAFSGLYADTGDALQFFTVQFDPRNWSYRMFGHNDLARDFLDRSGWVSMTERQFVDNLYRLRGRPMPDLAPSGVQFSDEPWTDGGRTRFGIEANYRMMSERRRNFEPVDQVRMTWRNPCLDIDLAVVDRTKRVTLVVDYKAQGFRINTDSTNVKALSRLHDATGNQVPAVIAAYEPSLTQPGAWTIHAYPANRAARLHLSYVMGAGSYLDQLAEVAGGLDWIDLTETQWRSVLDTARDL